MTSLGVGCKSHGVKVGGKKMRFTFDGKVQKVAVDGVGIDLSAKIAVTWW